MIQKSKKMLWNKKSLNHWVAIDFMEVKYIDFKFSKCEFWGSKFQRPGGSHLHRIDF